MEGLHDLRYPAAAGIPAVRETRFTEDIRQGVAVEYVSDIPEHVRKEYAERAIAHHRARE